ncbi:MAG TPA: ubiquinone/menaquinone biosynthesis methyltransferase [Candidatus Bathyarchaeia archaeon]|nr:ubiquinone/menaquinone biosynthesis methyltransferase [Candidatus Bathyarchaeia archaeon]
MSEGPVHFGYRTVAAAEKKRLVQDQFTPIATTYDRADAVLSLGLHFLWKRATIRRLGLGPGDRVLDVCGGTADLALLAARGIAPDGQAVVCDLNRPMMAFGRTKSRKSRRGGLVAFVQGDAEALPFPDASFDAVTVGFGLRNLVNLDRGLAEIGRVLKPGGRMSALEFSLPRRRWQRRLYAFYSYRIMLPLARILTGTDGPFRYLVESIRVFAGSGDIPGGLGRAGLAETAARPLSLGLATIYSGRKPKEVRHAAHRS